MKPFLLLGLCAALSLTSCTKDNRMETERRPGYGRDGLPHADEPPKEVRTNPNRKQHYQMVVKIKDAPLTFQVIRGSEQYQATNCRYTTSWFAGATANPHHAQKLHYIKVDDTTYVTDFYTDTPLNEDYYGQGVCVWQFLGVGTRLIPTGQDKRETRLSADVEPEDLAKLTGDNPELKKIFHYEKKYYPIEREFNFDNGWPDTGVESWNKKVTDFPPNELFSVELTIRRL